MEQKLGSEEVVWDLTHLYSDTNDRNINRDIETIKSKIGVFSTEYRGKLRNIQPEELHRAVTEMEEIEQSSRRSQASSIKTWFSSIWNGLPRMMKKQDIYLKIPR